jgi:hypothetical protein
MELDKDLVELATKAGLDLNEMVGQRVGSLEHSRDDLIRAVDVLFAGF